MEHTLPRVRPVILKYVALLSAHHRADRPADPWQHPPQRTCELVRKLAHGCRRFLGNDQGVPRGERVQIEDRDHMGVLVQLLSGDLATNNLAENRV